MIALNLLRTFWKPLAGVLLALALLWAWNSHEATVEQRGYGKGHVVGLKDGYAKGYGAAIDERQAADDQKLAEAMTQARSRELELQDRFADQSVKRQQEKVQYEKALHDLRSSALAGNSGMRLPAGTCQGSSVLPANATPEGAGTAGGSGGTATGVDLLPATAASVLDAAGQLRQFVRDRNSLIVLFNECRATANAP